MNPFEIVKINAPRHRKKVAMFDMDWTLIKPKGGRTFPKDVDDWEWLRPTVPQKIKTFYDKGFAIVIFTNQTKAWKQGMIVNALTSISLPCTAVIAFDKTYHKPDRRIFDAFVGKRAWDTKKSFFVGDALGRAADFADSDRKFAEALGIKVLAPEDVFPFEKKSESSLNKVATVQTQEVIVMVGYSGSGKSTVAQQVFGASSRYAVIDGDVLKTVPKMLSTARKALKEGKSVVFDATNGTKERRAKYMEVAKEFSVPARCVHVNTTMEEAIARNNARPIAKGVPKIAYYTYRKRFQEPTADEGCSVVTI